MEVRLTATIKKSGKTGSMLLLLDQRTTHRPFSRNTRILAKYILGSFVFVRAEAYEEIRAADYT